MHSRRIIFVVICIFAANLFANIEEPVGTPVMSPGLNAYIYELGEKHYSIMFNMGAMNATDMGNSNFSKRGYLMLGSSFYFNIISIFEAGYYLNFSLGGRNENIITSGVDVRLHLLPISFLDILYLKCGLGVMRFHSGIIKEKGFELPWGAGMELATGQHTVFNVEYVRRPIYFSGPSVWNLMFALGYAW